MKKKTGRKQEEIKNTYYYRNALNRRHFKLQ